MPTERKNITYAIPAELYHRAAALFPNTPIGARDNLVALLDAYENRNNNSVEHSSLLDELRANLEAEQLRNSQLEQSAETAKTEIASLTAQISELNSQPTETLLVESTPEYIGLLEKYTSLQDDYNNVCSSIENGKLLSSDEYEHYNTLREIVGNQSSADVVYVEFPPAVKALLDETAKRLSEKYNMPVSHSDLLAKMFLRYTVERYTEWFYPFVIKDSDIEIISGISVQSWKNFINNGTR